MLTHFFPCHLSMSFPGPPWGGSIYPLHLYSWGLSASLCPWCCPLTACQCIPISFTSLSPSGMCDISWRSCMNDSNESCRPFAQPWQLTFNVWVITIIREALHAGCMWAWLGTCATSLFLSSVSECAELKKSKVQSLPDKGFPVFTPCMCCRDWCSLAITSKTGTMLKHKSCPQLAPLGLN